MTLSSNYLLVHLLSHNFPQTIHTYHHERCTPPDPRSRLQVVHESTMFCHISSVSPPVEEAHLQVPAEMGI